MPLSLYSYSQNGLLDMLDRNRKIKRAPERWQDTTGFYDVIVTCEERCFDAVCEGNCKCTRCLELLSSFANNTSQLVTNARTDLIGRGEERNLPVHIINVEIKDNHEDAMLGGKAILQLAEMVSMLHKSLFARSLSRLGLLQSMADILY